MQRQYRNLLFKLSLPTILFMFVMQSVFLPGGQTILFKDWATRQHFVTKLASRVGHVFQNPDDQLFSRDVKAEVVWTEKSWLSQ